MSIDNITQTEAFVDFVERIKTFCDFIETRQSDNCKSFLETTQRQLLELYSYARNLPDFDLPDNESIIEIEITDEGIKDILSFIGDRLQDPYYWIVFDPTKHEDTVCVCGDLVDDLSDIYKDLKTFLIGFKAKDDAKQNALWHLKLRFDNHWNDHCINAIYAIHYFRKRAE